MQDDMQDDTPFAHPAETAEAPAPPPLVPTSPGAEVRVSLGGEEWADLRPISSLRAKHRREVIRRLDSEVTTGSVAMNMSDYIMGVMIAGWSLPLPLPGDAAGVAKLKRNPLDDLTLEQEDALSSHPLILQATRLLAPSAAQRTAEDPSEPSTDPDSPTGPSGV